MSALKEVRNDPTPRCHKMDQVAAGASTPNMAAHQWRDLAYELEGCLSESATKHEADLAQMSATIKYWSNAAATNEAYAERLRNLFVQSLEGASDSTRKRWLDAIKALKDGDEREKGLTFPNRPVMPRTDAHFDATLAKNPAPNFVDIDELVRREESTPEGKAGMDKARADLQAEIEAKRNGVGGNG